MDTNKCCLHLMNNVTIRFDKSKQQTVRNELSDTLTWTFMILYYYVYCISKELIRISYV